MNQMRPVAKRDNLYTLSLFALKLWLFRLKYVLKLRKHTFKDVEKFSGVPLSDAESAQAPSRVENLTLQPKHKWNSPLHCIMVSRGTTCY